MGIKEDTAAADAREGKLGTKEAAQVRGVTATAATNEAQLPFAGPQAGATLTKTKQQIAAEKLDYELKLKGPPLPTEVDKKLTDLADAYQGFRRLGPRFKDDYAGTVLDTPTELESKVQDRFPSFGTKGQSDWWKDMRTLEIAARNAIFGASLQPNEQKAWAETTISPGMSGEAIRTNLARREQIVRERLSRETEAARAGGFRPAQIEAKLGRYASDFTPEAIAEYYKSLDKEPVEQPGAAAPSAPKEGGQVGGKPITGWRFSDEAGKAVNAVARDPKSTPEDYARTLTNRAVAEGHVKPEEAEDYYREAVPAAQDYYSQFKTPEARRQIPEGLDYESVDRVAREQAGVGQVVGQAVTNLPASAGQMYQGLLDLPKDAALSALTGDLQGSTEGIVNLATGDKPSWQAMADTLSKDYLTGQGFKNKFATDPLGVVGDASTVLGAGGLMLRAPSIAGRTGAMATRAGQLGRDVGSLADFIDPLTRTNQLVGLTAKYGTKAMGSTGRMLQKPMSELVGWPSSANGPAIREATGAGFERGRTGAPTPRSTAFTEAMRSPEDVGQATVDIARKAIAALRKRASDAYTASMAQFGGNPVPLDIQKVRDRMTAVKPKDYDAWDGSTIRPPEHRAWDQMNTAVEEYAAKAAANPALLNPMEMDLFKQRLYDVGSKLDGMPDGKAKHIAQAAYDGVKDELIAHDPVYAEIMKNYGEPIERVRELEDTFSLAQARGKPIKYDTAARKLDTIMRNNYTNYGRRMNIAEEMFAADTTGTLKSKLAGGMVGAWKPRGVNVTAGLPVVAGAGYLNLGAIPGAMALSPRIMGELSYGAGRAAGTASRLASGVGDIGVNLANLRRRHPTADAVLTGAPLARAQLGSRLEGMEIEQASQAPAGEPPVAGLEGLDLSHLTPEEEEMLRNAREGRPGFAYGGAVRRLGQRYNCGGPVMVRR